MSAGDTCYALDGTYIVVDTDPAYPNHGWTLTSVGGTAQAPKRFTSLSQDPTRVVIKSARPASQDTITLIGAVGGTQSDYLTFDHLGFEGRFHSYANIDGLQYHHNVARCPNVGSGGGNHAFVYLQSMPAEMHRGLRVFENLFLLEPSCGNTAGTLVFITLYHTNGAIVEHNDFVNSSSINMHAMMNLKQGNKDATIRYNFIKGNGRGDPHGVIVNDCDGVNRPNEWGDRSAQGGSPRCNNRIYQNILSGTSGGPQPWDETDMEEWIYNNTIFSSATRCLGSNVSFANGSRGHHVFNNICAGPKVPADGHVAWPTYGEGNTTCVAHQAYFDNNLYWPASGGTGLWKDCSVDLNGDGTPETKRSYATLAEWIAHLASSSHEQSSRTADPQFVAPDSSNFRLKPASPARFGGRGGDWPYVLGAYITGDEQIGCSAHARCIANGGAPPSSGAPARVVGAVRTDTM